MNNVAFDIVRSRIQLMLEEEDFEFSADMEIPG